MNVEAWEEETLPKLVETHSILFEKVRAAMEDTFVSQATGIWRDIVEPICDYYNVKLGVSGGHWWFYNADPPTVVQLDWTGCMNPSVLPIGVQEELREVMSIRVFYKGEVYNVAALIKELDLID